MQKTLSEIINTALSDAEKSQKLASARDAVPAAGLDDFLAEELTTSPKVADDTAHEDEEKKREEDRKRKETEKKSSSEILTDAQFAMKCAEALEAGAAIISAKFANDGTVLSAPGPAVVESQFHTTPTVSPKPQANGVTDRIEGHTPQPSGLPNTAKDFTSVKDESGAPDNHPGKTSAAEDWTKDKTAAARLLRVKIAEAETLMSLGHIAAAEQILTEVKTAQAKMAQDPSSPPPVMPAHSDAFKLDVEPGAATHIPDNAGLISITKAQAKDPTTREATQHMIGTPKKDNAVAAHTLRTDGQKLSAAEMVLPKPQAKTAAATPAPAKPAPVVTPPPKTASVDPAVARAYLERIIKTASDPTASQEERAKAASTIEAIKKRHGVDPTTMLQA